MAVPSITDFWKTYTGILGPKINSRVGYSSKLYAIQRDRRQAFEEESGFALKHVQYEQVGITADASAEWTAGDNAAYPEAIKANNSDNYGGSSSGDSEYDGKSNVDPPMDKLGFAKTENGYGIIQKAFQSSEFSVESLKAAARNKEQVDQIVGVLADYAAETSSRIAQDEQCRISGTRMITTGTDSAPTFTETSDRFECFSSLDASRWTRYGFDSTVYDVAGTIDSPNEQTANGITWGHLDKLYERAYRNGLTKYESTMVEGQPVLYLVTDWFTANRLLRDGVSELRTDIRESSKADSLLTPLGVTHSLRGWVIIPEAFGRRFTITGDTADSSGGATTGSWTEQQYYGASTTGRTVNSSWTAAGYAESYVLTPNAMNTYVPRPGYTGVGATQFTPQNYMGDYEFFVDKDKNDNPFGSHGVFQGKFGCGAVALEKTLLTTIRHKIGVL